MANWWEEKDETQDYETIPEGTYQAQLTNAKTDETAMPMRLTLEFTIIEGKFENRKMWQNFNWTPSSLKYNRWQLGVWGAWQAMRDAGCESEDQAFRMVTDFMFQLVKLNKTCTLDVKHNFSDKTQKTYANCIVKELTNKEPVGNAPTMDSNDEIPF